MRFLIPLLLVCLLDARPRVCAVYVEIKSADHLLAVDGKLEESVVPTMIEWMRVHAN